MATHATLGNCQVDHLQWFRILCVPFSLHEVILGHLHPIFSLEAYMIKMRIWKKENCTSKIRYARKSSFLPATMQLCQCTSGLTCTTLYKISVPPLFKTVTQAR